MTGDRSVADVSLAAHLVRRAEELSPDSYHRLARIVARVLVSKRLRERRKWCDLARELAGRPGVEDRLVRQALRWPGARHHELGTAPPNWNAVVGLVLNGLFAAIRE